MKNFEQFGLNFEKDKAKSSHYQGKKHIAQKKKEKKNNSIRVYVFMLTGFLFE